MKKIFTLITLSFSFSAYAQNCVPNTNSLTFDGISTYATMPSTPLLEISDSLTIEAWINASSWASSPAGGTIVCKHGWSFGEEGFVLRAGGAGQLSLNIAGDSSGVNASWKEVVSNTNALQLNTWYHVAGTFDGNELKIYINGVLAGTQPFQGTITSPISYNFNIGRLADVSQPFTRFWAGKMDEIRIWNRALTQAEIAANRNHHIDPLTTTGLAGYWRMNDGSGSSLMDLGPGNLTGNILNGTWSNAVPFTEGPLTPLITLPNPYDLFSSASTGNQWNLNGNPISGATSAFYTPTQNGTYTVTVTDSLGCSATSLPYLYSTVGLSDISLEDLMAAMTISGRQLYFNSSSSLLNKTSLRISDLNGKKLVENKKGELTNSINLETLTSGVYLLTLRMENSTINKKIILH